MPPPPSQNCVACQVPLPPATDQPAYLPCRQCGTLHLRPLPRRETNAAFEGEDTAHSMAMIDDVRLPFLQRRLQMLAPAASPAGRRLLDVGCSAGRLMRLAREAGWDVTGLEMAEALAREARAHNPGARVITGDILEMDPASLGTYHAIVALDVIEHVLDPARFLAVLVQALEPGGQLLLHTPNARGLQARLRGHSWTMRIPEYHFHLFTPHGLRRTMEQAGLSVSTLTTSSGTGTETGARVPILRIKESLLAPLKLGNALLAVGQK